jgi:hypothetical protein
MAAPGDHSNRVAEGKQRREPVDGLLRRDEQLLWLEGFPCVAFAPLSSPIFGADLSTRKAPDARQTIGTGTCRKVWKSPCVRMLFV